MHDVSREVGMASPRWFLVTRNTLQKTEVIDVRNENDGGSLCSI